MRTRNKQRWWDKEAGPAFNLILFAVCGAAALIVLSGCDSIDTTPPEYKFHLFETSEERSRRHDMRRQDWRTRESIRRERWKSRHGIY